MDVHPNLPAARVHRDAPAHLVDPRLVALLCLAHLICLTGFFAMKTAAESWGTYPDLLFAGIRVVLVAGAGWSAAVLAHRLPPPARDGLLVVTVSLFGLTGFSELGPLFSISPLDSIWLLVMPAAYVAVLVFPAVFAAMAAFLIGPDETGSSTARRIMTAVAAGVLCVAAVFAGITRILGSAAQPDDDTWLLASAAVGCVAALVLLSGLLGGRQPYSLTVAMRLCAAVVCASALHISVFTAAQLVYADAVGIGGALIGLLSVRVFAVSTFVLLALALMSAVRPTLRP